MFFNIYHASLGATRILFRTTVYPAKILGLGIVKIRDFSSKRRFSTGPSASSTSNKGGRKRDFLFRALGLAGLGMVTFKAKGTYEEYQQLKKDILHERERHLVDPLTLNPWQILFLKKFPTRFLSRMWGELNSITLPTFLRSPILGTYSWLFSCNFDECTASSYKEFLNLNEFFTRSLKSGIRPLSDEPVVSPADGKVLYFSEVTQDRIEAVKGVTYSAKKFLFGDTTNAYPPLKPNHKLMTCTIYLSPGDYHRYHSPADWTVSKRLHYPGELWSVAPSVVRIIDGLFNYNERAVLTGNWHYGFFSFTAIGAYNVGSILFNFDKDLKTNLACHQGASTRGPVEKVYNGIEIHKGDEVGHFKLGSSIVLLFEAPMDFEFTIEEGQKVKYGESIGQCGAAPGAK